MMVEATHPLPSFIFNLLKKRKDGVGVGVVNEGKYRLPIRRNVSKLMVEARWIQIIVITGVYKVR